MLVDPNQAMYYHIVSRCVRRAWLCGRHGRRDYSHRRAWLETRIKQLAPCFAIDVHAYAVMSNHFHLVVHYDPLASTQWSPETVAERWLQACPPKDSRGEIDHGMLELQKHALLQNPAQIEKLRVKIGSLSVFMQLLKQPISRRANLEDGCQGHFFEKRFYSGALLSEEALLAAMAYVDLNPIRAGLVNTLEACDQTSLAERIRLGDLDLGMRPVVSGLHREAPIFVMTIAAYMTKLNSLIVESNASETTREALNKWRQQVSLIKLRQRAFGSAPQLSTWLGSRGLSSREEPL